MAPCSVAFAQALSFRVRLKHGALGLGFKQFLNTGMPGDFKCGGFPGEDLEGLHTYLVYTWEPKGVAI